jgi:hypothetical protein
LSKRLILFLTGALTIGLIVTGCGDSDSDTNGDTNGGSTASLTKAQFIKQADAICKAGSKEIEDETEAYAKENGIDVSKEPTDKQKEELVVEVIVPNIAGQADKIGALGAPSGEEDQVDEILTGIETAAAETSDDPSIVISGKEGAFADVNKLAQDFGLEVCGQS